MVFYAYISNVHNDAVSRELLIFADAATADEWWRAVSTSSIDALTNSIKRVNPQLYMHDTKIFDSYYFFDNAAMADIAKNFRGRLIITWLSDRSGRNFEVIPTGLNGADAVDHVSGNWFYIRSKADTSMYWYYEHARNKVVASKIGRTLFRVVAPELQDKAIMIGSDKVTLTMYPDIGVSVNKGEVVGGPVASARQFEFGNLASGRTVLCYGTYPCERSRFGV